MAMITLHVACVLLVLPHHGTGHVCHVSGTSADCRGRALTSVPSDLPPTLTSLDLSDNEIRRLETSSFCGLPALTSLSLRGNALFRDNQSVPRGVFGPVSKLTALDLSGNAAACVSLPPVCLSPLQRLEALALDLPSSTLPLDLSSLASLTTLTLTTLECTREVSNQTFSSLAEVPLQRLRLTGQNLLFLHRDAFQPVSQRLQQLEVVDLPDLSLPDVIAALHVFQGRNMSLIRLEGLSGNLRHHVNDSDERHVINSDQAKIIRNICVTNLSLANNALINFDNSIMQESTCLSSSLVHFDVHCNLLTFFYGLAIQAPVFRRLMYLDASMACGPGVTSTTSVTKFGISSSVRSMSYSLPPNIVHIDISHSILSMGGVTVPIRFLRASHLRLLNISYSKLSKCEYPFEGLEELTTLDISGNDLGIVSPNFTKYFHNLRALNMRDASLDPQFLMMHGLQFFGYLKNLERVDLSANRLLVLPPNVFNNLREVVLASNSFTSVPVQVDQMPRLDVLDLTFNSIAFLSSQQRNQLDALAQSSNGSFRLLLEGNPLSCDCSVLDFVSWLSSTSMRLDRGGNYSCVTDGGVFTTTAEVGGNLERKWRECVGSWWLGTSSAWLVVTLMTLVLAFLVSRFWTNVQHVVLRMAGFGHALLRRADFRYDVYVAYSDEDYRFACLDLLPLLEADGLRVYVRDRDDTPGQSRAEEVVSAVGKSWRIVFLLTEAFLRDEWCHFTALTAARCSASPHGPGRVLLVLLRPLPRADLPPSLLTVVEEQDVFDLGGEHPGPALWGRLLHRIKEQ